MIYHIWNIDVFLYLYVSDDAASMFVLGKTVYHRQNIYGSLHQNVQEDASLKYQLLWKFYCKPGIDDFLF